MERSGRRHDGGDGVLDGRVGAAQSAPHHPRVDPLRVATLLERRARPAPRLASGASTGEALALLAGFDAPALLVVDDTRPLGWIDAARLVRPGADGVPLADLLTPCGDPVGPEDTLYDCLQRLRAGGNRYLAVVSDAQGPDLLSLEEVLAGLVEQFERICREHEVDWQVLYLRGTYSC